MAVAQSCRVHDTLELCVEIRVLDLRAIGTACVDFRFHFGVRVPFHASEEELFLEFAVVVAHELLGGPAGVVCGVGGGAHFCDRGGGFAVVG